MNRRLNFQIGAALLVVVGAAALLAYFWTPYDPLAVDIEQRLFAPSSAHWLGTDEFGRDVLSRILAGAATSVSIAFATTTLALLIGTPLGLLAGYAGGWSDRILMVGNDALLAFPGILLALAFIAVIGPGVAGVVVALAIAYAPVVLRIVRSSALSISRRSYVEASRLMGNTGAYTMLRHVLPNSLGPLLVLTTSMLGWVLLSESALSFLGLGVAPPEPTWGNMLAASRSFFASAPWLSLFPGLCITLTLLGTNLLGDSLRDRADPNMVAL